MPLFHQSPLFKRPLITPVGAKTMALVSKQRISQIVRAARRIARIEGRAACQEAVGQGRSPIIREDVEHGIKPDQIGGCIPSDRTRWATQAKPQ